MGPSESRYSESFSAYDGHPSRLAVAAGSLPEVTIGPRGAVGLGKAGVVSGTPLTGIAAGFEDRADGACVPRP